MQIVRNCKNNIKKYVNLMYAYINIYKTVLIAYLKLIKVIYFKS